MKKLLSVGLTALLALGLFAGCASNDDTVTTKAPEANPPAQSQENLVQEQATELIDAPVTDQVQAPVSEPESQNPTADAPVQAPVSSPSEETISADEAKAIALNHAGFTEGDIRGYRAELDRERSGLVYEIEFVAGNYEYEYEVDAVSGAVLKAEKEFND